jgi:hypothetical protein
MNSDEFISWKNHHVTKRVMDAIRELVYEGQVELGGTAGIDAVADRYKVGKINGLETILYLSLEDISTEENDE